MTAFCCRAVTIRVEAGTKCHHGKHAPVTPEGTRHDPCRSGDEVSHFDADELFDVGVGVTIRVEAGTKCHSAVRISVVTKSGVTIRVEAGTKCHIVTPLLRR